MTAYGVFDGCKFIIAFACKRAAEDFRRNGSKGLVVREIRVL